MHGFLRLLVLVAGLLCVARPQLAAAQLIQVKTLPVATGDQFLVHPVGLLGMGGVDVAVDDTLHDAWVNPALGARVQGGVLFGAPTLYTVSDGLGDGRTLPVGGVVRGERWFGGATLALQQLEGVEEQGGRLFLDVQPLTSSIPPRGTLRDRNHNNLYASGLVGRRLSDGRTSVGVGASFAGLGAVDGVDLLYAGSRRIEQGGSLADVRLGVARETAAGAAMELLLLHNRLDVEHDVTYLTWQWDSVARFGRPGVREEHNEDRTRTWGAHLGYKHPLRSGWRVGTTLTGNYKWHPKIPNYQIMNIPRDPGTSWAYNLGVGAARRQGPATLAVDVVYEPIWSHTWADAEVATPDAQGDTIAPGERTVENHFRFHNAAIRLGAGRETERYGFQLGVEARSYNYRLEQEDHVARSDRAQHEGWMEWAPSWGVGLFFPEFRVRYGGRATTGTGRPGVARTVVFERATAASLASDFVVAPSGALTLDDALVLTHQVVVVVPVR